MSDTDKKWNKIALIGAGHGLGEELRIEFLPRAQQILAVSHEIPQAHQLDKHVNWLQIDFGSGPEQEQLLSDLTNFAPQLVVCSLEREPTDEVNWDLIVSALFPARLWRWALTQSSLQQAVVVAIDRGRESKLSTLLKNLVADQPAVDLRLYSLPAEVQMHQEEVWSFHNDVTRDFIAWLRDGPRYDHRRLAVGGANR